MFYNNLIKSVKPNKLHNLTAKALFSSQKDAPIKKIVVIGAGLMGSGIVQVSAQANYQVTMFDQSTDALKRGEGIIKGSLKRVAKKKFPDQTSEQDRFIDSVATNYKTSNDITKSVQDADLVIEAIVENLQVKQKLFNHLDQAAPENTIFCSNTSSLPISEIAAQTKRKDKFAGLHFFNPVPQMKLVEVISIKETLSSVHSTLMDYSVKIGKTPISCKDTPGFIVNRLLVPYMLESIRLYERGDASMKDIDTGMKLGAGYPMGPFELMDYVGLDTTQFISEQWFESNPHLKGEKLVAPTETLKKMVSEGRLGRKSGKGFYDYSK